MNKIYKKSEFPKKEKSNQNLSVDVIMCSSSGYLDIGYYSFHHKEWDCNGVNIDPEKEDFTWMYAPKELLEGVK